MKENYKDYVFFKYDKDNIYHKGLFYKEQYNWLMRNYESEDCAIELYDDNDKKQYIQFNPETFIISHKKKDIEKILK
jgi:hypothetical protein